MFWFQFETVSFLVVVGFYPLHTYTHHGNDFVHSDCVLIMNAGYQFVLLRYSKYKSYKGIGDSRGGCAKSDKLPQVKSLELASVGFEDYKFNKENSVKL